MSAQTDRTSSACDRCRRPMANPAPDDCTDPEHRRSDSTLGLREADCGCCFVVDKVALEALRSLIDASTPTSTTDPSTDTTTQEIHR